MASQNARIIYFLTLPRDQYRTAAEAAQFVGIEWFEARRIISSLLAQKLAEMKRVNGINAYRMKDS